MATYRPNTNANWTRAEPINGLGLPAGVAAPTILEEHRLIFFGTRLQPAIYITAHGVADAQQFTPNRALQFYLPHGGLLTYHARTFPNFAAGMPPAGQLHAAAAPNCFDYKLSKYQGRHSADGMAGYPETYNRLALKSVQQNATFVTIRNRLTSPWQRLSYVLERIIANCPNVVTVHCLFCRETNPAVPANDRTACGPHCFTCGG